MSRTVCVLGHRSGSRVGRIIENEGHYSYQEYIGDGIDDHYGESITELSFVYDAALQMVGQMLDDQSKNGIACPSCANQKQIAQEKHMVMGFPVRYNGEGQYYSIPDHLLEAFPLLRSATDGTGKFRVGYYKLPKNWFFQSVLVPAGGNLHS